MKHRKKIISGFVLAALVGLGVGYAALSDSLQIKGTLSNPESDLIIEFDTANADTQDTDKDGVTVSYSSNTAGIANHVATIGVTDLKNAGETASINLTVKNVSGNGLSADVTIPETVTVEGTDASAYYRVSVNWDSVTGTTATIADNDNDSLTVKVELLKTPISTINGEFSITLNATAALATA